MNTPPVVDEPEVTVEVVSFDEAEMAEDAEADLHEDGLDTLPGVDIPLDDFAGTLDGQSTTAAVEDMAGVDDEVTLASPPPTTALAENPAASHAPDKDATATAPEPPEPPQAAANLSPTQTEASNEVDTTAASAPRSKRSWFRDFFSDDYLRTVRTPTPAQVTRQADFIEQTLGLERGAAILDVGCGLGLQAVELSKRGYLVVGLDLSLPMLSRAAEEAQDQNVQINFLHADMRELSFDGAFDAIVCLGTTFGYFDDDTNALVIQRMYRALKPMGLLLLDVMNRDYVHNMLPGLVWFDGDDCVCMEETRLNYITSRLEVKRTVIADSGQQHDTRYSLRLYALHELGSLLHRTGFRVAQVSGRQSTPGVFFGAHSPHMLLLAERRMPQQTDDDNRPDSMRHPT
ncbi:MAG: class I SAM-dependent methyltransferase [Polyangiales bacterium]